MDWTILTEAEQVTDEMLAQVESTVEWFLDEPMGTEDFIDRFCKDYSDGWDIESFDNAAVRKIMRHARATKREMTA